MSESRSKILDKAKKLKELADRGIGGEMDNAKVMFGKYIEKHNITKEELEGHTIHSSYVKMTDEQFMKEMVADFIVFGLGVFLSKVFKTPFDREQKFNDLSDKYTQAVKDRTYKR